MNTSNTTCPCGSTKAYTLCCGQAHQELSQATTAEALMRSRYTAFTMANGDYLMQSHHKSTRPVKEKKAIVRWAKSVQWMKLEVLRTTQGGVNDITGTVEFKAYYFEQGRVQVIHEHSRFVKENNCWYYVDAL